MEPDSLDEAKRILGFLSTTSFSNPNYPESEVFKSNNLFCPSGKPLAVKKFMAGKQDDKVVVVDDSESNLKLLQILKKH